jgi:lipoate-protein ligase B
MTTKIVNAFSLGRMKFSECLLIQKYLVSELIKSVAESNTRPGSILLVEHEPVYTIGIRRERYTSTSSEIVNIRSLNKANIEYTDRGGLITFHGPGQLVAYPILDIKSHNLGLKSYVSKLEKAIIDLCKCEFQLEAHRMCQTGYTGVWCDNSKVAAIGVHCKRNIAYHGIALNCNVDLDWFKHIVPCGIEDKTVGSLSQIVGKPISVDQVQPLFLKAFANAFDVNVVVKSQAETDALKEQTQLSQ